SRGICRSSNNPVADHTERLVADRLHLELRGNSASGYDAEDEKGLRYQIKGRRITSHNRSTQLSAIRRLTQHPFDFLVGVIYNSDFSVAYGGIVPHSVVLANSVYKEHVNAHIFHMRRTVLAMPGVVDITERLLPL